jgi:RimJ/RimL family protein N-acetyltransferase
VDAIEGIRTDRLLLRPWRTEDLPAFAAMNADPKVMEHFPAALSKEESESAMARIVSHFATHGFGFWAVEVPGRAPFIGFIGLSIPRFVAHFTPCVEIGWRLAQEHWGRGYATEGARAALLDGFNRLDLDQIVSFSVPTNLRSRRVMEKLGMHTAPDDDFDHPLVPARHRLRRHLLYRLSRTETQPPRSKL